MKKTLRSVFAALLAFVMMLSLAACGQKEESTESKETTAAKTEAENGEQTTEAEAEAETDSSTWPVITFGICTLQAVTDMDVVNEALNAYLISINAGVLANIVDFELGNLGTVMTLMLTSTENPVDLFNGCFYTDLASAVANEQCIPLDDYLEQYPDLKEIIGEKFLGGGVKDGVQYGLPVIDAKSTCHCYMLRRDVAEAIGVDDQDGTLITLDELTEILIRAKAAYPAMAFNADATVVYANAVDGMGDSNLEGVLLNRGVGETEIVNFYESSAFTDYLAMAEVWKAEGLFISDPLNADRAAATNLKNGTTGGEFYSGYSADAVKVSSKTYGDFVIFQLDEPVANVASGAGGSCYYISSVCQNPDAAMKMLYLLYTDATVATYVAQGIEGRHYVLDENGCSWYAEGKDLSNVNWVAGCPTYFPNGALTHPFNTDDPDYFTKMVNSNTTCTITDGFGFVFDNSEVYDQYTAAAQVRDEYLLALIFNEVDIDETLPMFQEELKEAGIEEVIAEKQAQFNAFLGK